MKSAPGPSAQPSAQAPAQDSTTSFVTAEQFLAMSDKWAEQFARIEAFLSRGKVFTTPKYLKPVPSHQLVSDKLFLAPSTWPTGPVETLVGLDAQTKPQK